MGTGQRRIQIKCDTRCIEGSSLGCRPRCCFLSITQRNLTVRVIIEMQVPALHDAVSTQAQYSQVGDGKDTGNIVGNIQCQISN